MCSANKGINFPHCFYLVMFCLHVHTHTQTSKSFLLFLVVKSEYSSLPVQHSSHFTLPVSSHNTSRTPILLSITTICLLFSINVTLHFLPASTLSFYAQTHTLTFTLGMGASSCILKWLILFFNLAKHFSQQNLILGFIFGSWHNFFFLLLNIYILIYFSFFNHQNFFLIHLVIDNNNKTEHNALKE